MRRSASVSLLVVALLLISAAPSHAWHRHGVRGGVFIGVGPSFWWGAPYPYWYYPPAYYYPPPYYVYTPPPVVVQETPVYTQRQPPPPPPPPQQSYWYYCRSANAYYPSVQTCPEAWVKVPPRPQ